MIIERLVNRNKLKEEEESKGGLGMTDDQQNSIHFTVLLIKSPLNNITKP